MKRKSIIAVLTLALVLALSLSILSSCDKKHKYSDEWKFDETNHWHECTIKKHTDTTEKTPHVLTWTEKTPAGVHTDKVEKGVCECGYTTERTISGTATHAYGEEWKKDASGHWHESTCDATAPTHDVMKSDFAAHTFGEGVVTKPADYGVVGEKKFTCTECGYSYTQDIDALGAKDNEIKLVDGKTLGKEYDGEVVSITKGDFVIAGDRTPTFMFKVKGADDNTYTATAPKKAGEYTVKVSAAATAEWKAATNTFDFAIAKKVLTATGTKKYDGNATMPVTLTGVVAGETVTATVTMTSKNVGATVKEVMLAGADKDNYVIDTADVVASITKKEISGLTVNKSYTGEKEFEWDFDSSDIVAGDDIRARITMESANVGAAVQSFEITGKDAGNYSLAIEDVNVAIVKADIEGFTISNADAFDEFFVGATYIPEPTTDYVGIGTGYGEMTVSWEMEGENGLWDPIFQGIERVRERAGRYRVRIQYAEGDNYNSEKTEYVYFTLKAKPRRLTVKSFAGKTYDGTPFANFTFNNLVNKFGANSINGVENITAATDSGEKYVEYRKKGEVLWTKVTGTNIPKNAAEYEYRIGVTATDEWVAVVSEIKTFTIAQVEIKLEKGYITTTYILQNGDLLYLASHTPVAGETIALRLVNEKAGLELSPTNSNYVKSDQKKQVSIQYNLDCFRLVATTNTNVSNYKIVKDPKQTSVEITVPPSGNGISKLITGKAEINDTANNRKQLEMWTAVDTGSFRVGQTVIVSDRTGTKLFEAKILKVSVVDPDGDGTFSNTSQSGCVIPSDGKVRIDIDVTGITYDVSKVVGGTVKVK